MYRRLLRFLRPHTGRMVGTILSSIGAAFLDVYAFALLIPFLNAVFGEPTIIPTGAGAVTELLNGTVGSLLDPGDPMGSLQRVIFIILAAVTAKNVLVWFSGQLGAQLQEYVTRDMRDAVYAHLQRLPLGYFTRTKAGQVLARVMTDTAQTKQLITQIVTQTLQSVAIVIGYVAFLFSVSWRLTLIALVVAPLLMGTLSPLLRRLRTGFKKKSDEYGEMTALVQEAVNGIRLVKSFRAEGYEEGRFVQASGRYARGMVRVTRLAFVAQPITEVIGTMITVLILWLGARQVLVDHTMQGSALIAFLAVVMRLLQPLKQLSQIGTTAQGAMASAQRVFEILDHPTETATDRGTREAPPLRDAVVFDRVSFAYGDEAPVLTDVSFTARRGDIAALVGPSGAGKSTLVDLIPRFNEPTAGRITIDGVETRDIRLASLRALTGIVSQDTVLFNDTVRANIAYGAPGKYTDAQIEAAARAANAHTFITQLPQSYDTVLGERGTRLSGGQRQRIAIARALLTDPPILILDEATSALDTESERLVQEAIDRLLAGRTVFVIAHRLSTIQHATQILVLDRGRIVERGTHDELLARRGAYYRLYSMQFRERGGENAAD
ncbi:MAG TPA: ABC transporter ATP-binding protein [Gemmatimonadaceae bacterium]|nr:ABC transporter ATP-binding protein [Gemmatimonadaceae bacterium]